MVSTMKQLVSSLLGVILLLGCVSQLKAGLIFTNLGPDGTYQEDGLLIGHHPTFIVNTSVAVQFTPSSTVTFADAVLALGYESNSTPPEIDVNLTTDIAGRPGTVLESFATMSEDAFPPSSLVTFTSVLQPILTAGSSYWLVVYAPVTTDGVWNYNSTNDLASRLDDPNFLLNNSTGGPDGPWTPTDGPRTAFQVDGIAVAVPEPGSLTLVGIAAACITARSRRRRNQAAGGMKRRRPGSSPQFAPGRRLETDPWRP
jgi:hypothetical protein